jgi:hypothetical protein
MVLVDLGWLLTARMVRGMALMRQAMVLVVVALGALVLRPPLLMAEMVLVVLLLWRNWDEICSSQ